MLITVWLTELPAQLLKGYKRYIDESGDLPVRLRFMPKQQLSEYLVFPNGRVSNRVQSGRVSKSIKKDIGDHIALRVIPENRDVIREFQTELGEAFSSMRDSVIETSRGRAASAAEQLHNALDNILDTSLTKRLNQHLGQIIPNHLFRVGSISQTEFARIVLEAAFSHYPICADTPDGDELELGQVGAGFQSNVLIALHRSVSSISKKKLIFCVEEPEIHLDPNAQRRAYHQWSALSREDNDVEQIIINSHSAFIVNESNPEELIVVRRNDSGRSVASQLPRSFLENHDMIHLKTKILGIKNSDLYFATGVVIVEGDSDAVALRGCIDLILKKLPSRQSLALLGISIIECGGCHSIPPLARVLQHLEIPCAMVFDRDCLQQVARSAQNEEMKIHGEKQFDSSFANFFLRLGDFFSSSSSFNNVKRQLKPLLRSGVPTGYPQAINNILSKHGILFARTEHETDFICKENAKEVASVVGYKVKQAEQLDETVKKLKEIHGRKLKKAHVTARIIQSMTSSKQISSHYRKLCNDIFRVLGITK